MKALGGVGRAYGLLSYGTAVLLFVSTAVALLPFSTPAYADDRPRPPVAREDSSRQRDIQRQQALAAEQRRQAEVQRDLRATQATATQRELARQVERQRADSLAAEQHARQGAGRVKTTAMTTATTLSVPLQPCNDAVPSEVLVPIGEGVQLIGKSWLAKNRGQVEAFIRGITVELTVGGVAIPNAERFFTAPAQFNDPVLGLVWITRWEYPLTVTTETAVAVGVRWTLAHQLTDLLVLSDDGTPTHHPAGTTAELSCTLVPAVTVTGRITGAGAGLADGRVSAADATTAQSVTGSDTNANGEFRMLVRPGAYRFFFSSIAGPWLPEWWDDQRFFSQATTVTLAFGVAPPRLLADLQRGVLVSGLVTDATTHLPVASVGVSGQRVDVACCESFFASTGADGRFRLVVPMNVTVKVGFTPQGNSVAYLEQWWNGRRAYSEADLLTVATTDVAGIDAALERGVFVRGRVTDAETAQPLAKVSVSASAIGVPCCQNFFASTNAQGEYAMPVRMNTAIKVGFFPPVGPVPYLPSAWNGKRSFSDADVLAVGTHDVTGIDGALEHGVFMRGRVTDALTTGGVGGVIVFASVSVCCETFFAQTSADGAYVTAVRKNVTLTVEFFPPAGSIPYLSQWFHGRSTFGTADPVVVGATDVGGVDAALERGVFLRGRVTEAATGHPIPAATVNVTRVDVPCCESSFAEVDEHGDYAVVVRKNVTVNVGFSAQFGSVIPYLPQWYHGKPTSDTADPVTVVTSDLFGIDAALERGVFVGGRVTDADTHEPISAVGVVVYLGTAGCCSFFTYAQTDSHGDYRFIAHQNVSLKINFRPADSGPSPYLAEWYHGRPSFESADVVAVGSADVSGIDAGLQRGATLSGRVTDALSGDGLANVGVNAQRTDGPCCEVFFAPTDSTGHYAVTVKRGISVVVGFFPSSGDAIPHLTEWWNGRRSFNDADPVAIGSADVANIDAALERGVFVRGHVTDAATGHDLPQVSVNAFVADVPCCENYFGFTDAGGDYVMTVPANVRVRVSFFPPFGTDLLQEYYNDKPDFGTADVISVGVTTVAGIDAALERGILLSGHVTDGSGAAIPGVSVNVETESCCGFVAGTATSFDGSYSLSLRPGTYHVAFYPPSGSDFLSEYYDDKPSSFAATPVVVAAAPVTGIDATLERAVFLSGRVSDAATGLGVQGVAVSTSPVDPGNAFVGFSFTDADGNYAILSRPGSYKVAFFPPQGSGLFFEFYDNVQDFGVATPVVVGSAPVTGIDAELGSDQDLSAPTPVDARVAQSVGTTDFVELGDAFTVTFSHRMDMTTTGDTLQLQDGDGTMVTLRCGAAPNDVACVWDDTGTTVTIAVEGNALDAVPAPGSPGSGTTPGMQIPFTITGLTGFADARGFIAYVLGAPDPIVDFE